MEITVLKNYSELSSTIADIVEKTIQDDLYDLEKRELTKFILPTGSTPLGLYEELVKRKLLLILMNILLIQITNKVIILL